MVGLTPAEGTPWPHAPEGFKGLWKSYPLSAIDPDRFRTSFGPLLAKLEEKRIVLEAFEPGNEINWAGFNADFSQYSACLNEQATVDRFVGHSQALVIAILGLQPSGNLFGRPVQNQFTRNDVP
jgi:hypothetical protein